MIAEQTTTERDARELALLAVAALDDKLGDDIVILDVGDALGVTDYFVIASGRNDRQVAALVDAVEECLRDAGAKPRGREGLREGRWALLDYGDLVVHVFLAEERDVYDLERLWKDAGRVDLETGECSKSAAD